MSDYIKNNIHEREPGPLINSVKLSPNCIMTTRATDTELDRDSDYRKIEVSLAFDGSQEPIDLAGYLAKTYVVKGGKLRFGRTYLNQYGANCDEGVISLPKEGIGNPKNIMALLHELGHIIAYNKDLQDNPAKAKASVGSQNRQGLEAKKFQYIIEQDAWKAGVLAGQQFRIDLGINIFALFSSSEDFINYINGPLGRHKAQITKAGSKADYKTLLDKRFEDYIRAVFENNTEV